jgi:tetratricopeptide (TPR) repeat protein
MKSRNFESLLGIALGLLLVGCNAGQSGDIPRSDLSKIETTEKSRSDLEIERAKGWIEMAPDRPKGYVALGRALMQKGRESGQLHRYNEALTSFEKAVEIAPKDSEALHSLAWCWTMFHQYSKSIEYAEKAIAIHPGDAFAHGVLCDSYMELGDIPKAAKMAQTMVDLRPDLSSYSRVAQVRWLMGDAKGAIVLMNRAFVAGGPYAENGAWAGTQLADMYWKTGAMVAAEQQYQRVLAANKEYPHAQFGLARIRVAQGKQEEALELMAKATEGNMPMSILLEYGDYLKSVGKEEEATLQFAKMKELAKSYRDHGIHGDDLALAAYYLDHGRDVKRGLDMCRHEVDHHAGWQGYGALAWAYYRNGMYSDAKKAMEKARASGVKEARLWYRDGLIHKALGREEEAARWIAAARNLNPHFDVLSKDAETTLVAKS